MSLAFPHRENFLAKKDSNVVGGTAAPAPAGDPPWCHGFCQRDNKQNNMHNPAPHHECKNTRHLDSAPTTHTAERYQQA